MTDLTTKSVPLFLSEYMSALNHALHLQENDGWRDYLMPVGDVLAIAALLVGNSVGNFLILEAEEADSAWRWIWMGPKADIYARGHMPKIFESIQDVSNLDVKAVYAGILVDLRRDLRGRRRNRAPYVAAR